MIGGIARGANWCLIPVGILPGTSSFLPTMSTTVGLRGRVEYGGGGGRLSKPGTRLSACVVVCVSEMSLVDCATVDDGATGIPFVLCLSRCLRSLRSRFLCSLFRIGGGGGGSIPFLSTSWPCGVLIIESEGVDGIGMQILFVANFGTDTWLELGVGSLPLFIETATLPGISSCAMFF